MLIQAIYMNKLIFVKCAILQKYCRCCMIKLLKTWPSQCLSCLSLSKVVTVSMIILQTECFLLCTFSWVLCVKVLSHSSHLMIRREDFSLQSCLPYPSCQKEAHGCLLDTLRTETVST